MRAGGARAPIALAVVLALGAPVGSPAATAGAAPRLAGTTTFTASASSTTTVHVPRAATLVVDGRYQSPNVALSGSGRIVGFSLTASRYQRSPAPSLLAFQVGMCVERGCRPAYPYPTSYEMVVPTALPSRRPSEASPDRVVTLPPGDYVVRAVTDGTPVRMTLRLAGLTGTSHVTVARRFAATLMTATSDDGPAGVNPLRNITLSHEFASDNALMFELMLMRYEPHVRNESGVCVYYGEAKPTTGRHHPGCPGAVGESVLVAGQPTLHYYGAMFGADIGLLPGKWTKGYYSSGVGGPSSLTVVTLWYDLV
ncbi:MAG TPA: hypothetical protein VF519_14600 [Mycobacteriales bacterium]|jgi:hypothetical protein